MFVASWILERWLLLVKRPISSSYNSGEVLQCDSIQNLLIVIDMLFKVLDLAIINHQNRKLAENQLLKFC
jgi:hypothetical protein